MADKGRDGTSLPGCVKTYLPWPTGRWGVVFEFRLDEDTDRTWHF
jgi:hypothetical protein